MAEEDGIYGLFVIIFIGCCLHNGDILPKVLTLVPVRE
jgi:hypothetical protein